jgi:hypothetical protein
MIIRMIHNESTLPIITFRIIRIVAVYSTITPRTCLCAIASALRARHMRLVAYGNAIGAD